MKERGYEGNLKLNFFATQGARCGQGRDLLKRAPEAALATCVLGALAYDIGYWFDGQ
jgi:hypothetical protein